MPASTIDDRLYSLKSFVPWRDPRPAKYLTTLFFLLEIFIATPFVLATQLGRTLHAVGVSAKYVGRPDVLHLLYWPGHLIPWYMLLWRAQHEGHTSVVLNVLAVHALTLLVTVFLEAAAAFGVYFFLFWVVGNFVPDYYGSARIAKPKELVEAGVFANDGVYAGYVPSGLSLMERARAIVAAELAKALLPSENRIIRVPADFHTVVFGPTGTGKTQDIILPTLNTWEGSIFAYALKGDLVEGSVGFRASKEGMNSEIHVVSLGLPEDPRIDGVIGSKWEGGINPLDVVNSYDDAREIVVALRNETGADPTKGDSASGSFFTVLSTEYLEIVITFFRYQYGAGAHLARILAAISRQAMPIELLTQIVGANHDPGGRALWHDENGRILTQDPTLVEIANKMLVNLSPEQLQSVVQNATIYLSPWHNKVIARATSHTTFNPADMRDPAKNVSVYLYSPYTRKGSNAPVVSVCTHAFIRMVARGDVPYKTARGRCLVVIDEADSVNVPVIENDINELRSMGLTFLLSYQGRAQVLKKYGPHERLTMACNAEIYLRAGDHDTEQRLTEKAGKMTLRAASPPNTKNMTYGEDFHDMARGLIEHDEGARIPDDRAILFLKTGAPGKALLRPVYIHRAHAVNEPEFRYRVKRPLPWETSKAA